MLFSTDYSYMMLISVAKIPNPVIGEIYERPYRHKNWT